MSVQNVVKKHEVGSEVQQFIDQGQEEILVAQKNNGDWSVTGDRKKFWSWLLTPRQVEELQEENKRIRSLVQKIQEDYDRYVGLKISPF